MDLTTVTDRLNEIRPDGDDASDSLRILVGKIGQMATGELKLDGYEDEIDDEKTDAYRRDLFAGTMVAAFEYASEHDIDPAKAIDERLERMAEQKERRDEIQDAIDDGDAAALADALDADGQEVPTDQFTDDDTDERGVY